MSRLGRGRPWKHVYRPNTLPPVIFDAVGGGAGGNTTSYSWTHTATAGAYVIADITIRGSSVSSCTYGGTAMTALQSVTDSGSNVTLARYVLPNAPGGAKTVTVTSGSSSRVEASSVSYLNVSSVGATTTASGSTSPASIAANCPAGRIIVAAIGAYSGGTPTLTPSGGTNRYNGAVLGASLAISDSHTSTTFSATASLAAWCALATVLI